MSEHTPTPWKVEPYVDAIDIHAEDGSLVAHLADRDITSDGMPPDNARFIVRACNAHDDLLAVCKEIEEASVYWSEYDVPLGILHRLRAAIANAEGA